MVTGYVNCKVIIARNQARKACRKAQRKLEAQVASEAKTNPKAFWNYVKGKTKTRTGIADLKREDGSKTKTDSEKAELLNQFFKSVLTTEDSGPLPDPPEYNFTEVLEDLEVTEEVVRKHLAKLHTGKAAGPDGLPPLILAKAAVQLAKPLAHLFQLTLDSRTIPEDWKV